MQFTLKYNSGSEYGTGPASTDYVATVKRKSDEVEVSFNFVVAPQGKSDPNVSRATIRTLDLRFSSQEAMQVASSIIAQAHHPCIHDGTMRWSPPTGMPILAAEKWRDCVTLDLSSWNKCIRVTNKSLFHLGTAKIRLDYSLFDAENRVEDSDCILTKVIDLLPDASSVLKVAQEDLPHRGKRRVDKFVSVNIVELTGRAPFKIQNG